MSEVHVRVSPVLTPDGTFLQRHVFPDLDGKTAEARCHHLASTSELRDDDPNIPLCDLCQELHGRDVAEALLAEVFSDGPDVADPGMWAITTASMSRTWPSRTPHESQRNARSSGRGPGASPERVSRAASP